ncbi:MAG: hypothetical protein AMXMBFR84_46050 [Candidatus Hydrogenedentota bacterium]
MQSNPYARFRDRDLTLNDHLAIDRTVLANERTLLAYWRTSIAMVITGGSAIKFFDSHWLDALGFLLILLAALVTIVGWRRYARLMYMLKAAQAHKTVLPAALSGEFMNEK